MLTIIIIGLFVVVICVFPVMFVAKKLGAEKTELVDCILAIIVGSIASSIIVPFIPGGNSSQIIYFLYSFLVVGMVYKYMLQANYIASVLIALISTLIKWAAIYVVGKVFT